MSRSGLPAGATPLDPGESEGLIPSHLATQGELDEAEAANIREARLWALGRKHRNCLSDDFLRKLHKRMFGGVWRWAGKYRTTGKNLGVEARLIGEEIRKLCDDTRYWIDHTTYGWDELGARFHHRLVSIHPFPNGNGRHARLMTDVLMKTNGQPEFSWGAPAGAASTGRAGDVRQRYLDALRAADRHDLAPLIAFVRS